MDIEFKTAFDTFTAEHKTALTGIKTQLDNLKTAQGQMQTQLDAIDAKSQQRHASGFEGKDLATELYNDAGFKAFAETGRGRFAMKVADLQKKTTITGTALGATTSGVVPMQRVEGIIPAALETFRIRQLLRVIPTTAAMIDWVRCTSYTKASPQVEASAKLEATIAFESVSSPLRTFAHWIPVSKQAIQDLAGLQEAVNVHLMAGLLDEEDLQILAGDSTDQNFTGLITQATAFDTSLVSASDGWERADVLARAIQQLTTAKQRVTGIVLNPADWWTIVLTKDTVGRYVHSDPANMTATRLWGLPVAVTGAISAGTFLVGDFQTGAALYLRQDGTIDISDSHDDFFTRNLLACRVEERALLAVFKPAAFCWGSLTTSPQ